MTGPLTGIRVLDLTNVLAGPFACHQLAHMGADIIKVEEPKRGDLARQLGADPQRAADGMGISFLAQNAGKRSIGLDLKADAGKAVLRRLVAGADVLVENFRPGVMDRLDLGADALRAINPELIYCAISGFGQDGPLRHAPAYDQIVQGMSGVMSITGGPDTAPYRVGYPMADTIGGLTAAFAIASALAKPKPGRGCTLDVSILEAVLATMGWVVSNQLIAGRDAKPLANENMTASPSGTFTTGNGLMNIAANKQEQFEALCDVIAAPELLADTRFASRQARLDHRTDLTAELEQRFAQHPAQFWIEKLVAAGVPAGPVLTVREALAHPQVAERGLITHHERDGDTLGIVGAAVKTNGAAPKVATPPPRLGEHSRAILAEAGYAPDEVDKLMQGPVR